MANGDMDSGHLIINGHANDAMGDVGFQPALLQFAYSALAPITALTRGLRSLNTVWAQHLSEEVKYRFYKN